MNIGRRRRIHGCVLAFVVAGSAGMLGCDDANQDALRPFGDDDALDGGTASNDGSSAPDGSPVDGAPDAPPAVAPFDWVGVIGTGQSLSTGYLSGAAVSSTQPFQNKKLIDKGPSPQYPADGKNAVYELVPLTEPFRGGVGGYGDDQYPNNITGETPNSGTANELSALWLARTGKDYVTLHSAVGWSGHGLAFIDKRGQNGTVGRAYPGSLAEARAFTAMAKAAGKTFGYGAVTMTHGESDATNTDYAAGLSRLIDDYNDDLKSITGQTRDVVLLVSQQSTLVGGENGSAVQVWKAGKDHPARIVCTGPKYQYAYADDALHMPAASYRAIGVKYAEIFDEVVNKGRAWKPVQPKMVSRSGKVITVEFDVPSPPLAWDETLAPPHQAAHTTWAQGRGFEVRSGGGEVAIAKVELASPTSVAITLVPDLGATAPLTVGYAITQDGSNFQGGRPEGLRGQLRDSDGLVGYDEETIMVNVTNGSSTASATKSGAFSGRGVRDVVTGAGVPAGMIISAKPSGDAITLSAPWPGASGVATIKVHHDLHNYAVHFYLAVP